MKRILSVYLSLALFACGTNAYESSDPILTSFNENRHDAMLDQKLQHILNQYFLVLDHLKTQDSVELQFYGSKMIQLADSLSQQTLSSDTLTQKNAMQGLMNIQSEMQAVLMESDPNEKRLGAVMLSLHWIELLATIGYQKQKLYIFLDNDGQQWLGYNKKSKNPYRYDDPRQYEANQMLQELK